MSVDLSMLNEQQKNAIMESINHNVVLMAGAGSGKTATLVKRTQYIIEELGVKPKNIMIVTFTNKAAGEIQERVSSVCNDAYMMWIGTFHKICTRLIRMFGEHMNIQNFSIMDTNASRNLIKEILECKGIEYNLYLIKDIQSKISEYKNNIIRPADVLASGEKKIYADVYQEYQNVSWRRRTFDFDDLIIYAILLLSSYPDVAEWVHENIKYIAVDESQDTCRAQFQLINMIAGNNNVMLIGDVNQSIYAFRNAKPKYLENFVNTHPNTIKLKLEQNYRSTKTIINAANTVIKNNNFGTKINMFCDNTSGDKIQIYCAVDAINEARWIVSEIIYLKKMGKSFSDFAIIYRANFQSSAIEKELTKSAVNYAIFGSQSFYSRKEVRDLIAFCKIVLNDKDIESFKRVLSTLNGIGKVTVDKIINNAQESGLSFHKAIEDYVKKFKVPPLKAYTLNMLQTILNNTYTKCSDIIEDVLTITDYKKDLEAVNSEETSERLDIIREFHDTIRSMENNDATLSMHEVIDQVSLLSDAKGAEKNDLDAVKLMTAHASKGLEFNTVFIIGAEEGLFPHANALHSINKKEAIEEERRLFYVAMTRAKEKLYITYTNKMITATDGTMTTSSRSRFLTEIPRNLTEEAL